MIIQYKENLSYTVPSKRVELEQYYFANSITGEKTNIRFVSAKICYLVIAKQYTIFLKKISKYYSKKFFKNFVSTKKQILIIRKTEFGSKFKGDLTFMHTLNSA